MGTDADNNLLDAVRVAAAPQSAGRGALVVLNNEIQAAREVTKTDSYRLETFRSGPMGFLGYADSDGAVAYYRYPERRHTADSEFNIAHIDELPPVDIAYAYAGASGAVSDALVAAGARGIVAAGLGSGGSPAPFMDGLQRAMAAGIPVVLATQVGAGRVLQTRRFTEAGYIVADNLHPKKAPHPANAGPNPNHQPGRTATNDAGILTTPQPPAHPYTAYELGVAITEPRPAPQPTRTPPASLPRRCALPRHSSDLPVIPADSPVIPADSPVIPADSPVILADSPVIPALHPSFLADLPIIPALHPSFRRKPESSVIQSAPSFRSAGLIFTVIPAQAGIQRGLRCPVIPTPAGIRALPIIYPSFRRKPESSAAPGLHLAPQQRPARQTTRKSAIFSDATPLANRTSMRYTSTSKSGNPASGSNVPPKAGPAAQVHGDPSGCVSSPKAKASGRIIGQSPKNRVQDNTAKTVGIATIVGSGTHSALFHGGVSGHAAGVPTALCRSSKWAGAWKTRTRNLASKIALAVAPTA